jgi:hypothetical protein
MTKFINAQSNFSSGELSEKLHGRVEVQQYKNGCKHLENFYIDRNGSITRRGGSRWVANTEVGSFDGCDGPAMIEFNFSVDQSYIVLLSFFIQPTFDGPKHFQVFDQDGVEQLVEFREVANFFECFTLDPDGFNYTQENDLMYVTHNSGTVEPFIIYRNESGPSGEFVFSVTRWNSELEGIPFKPSFRGLNFPYNQDASFTGHVQASGVIDQVQNLDGTAVTEQDLDLVFGPMPTGVLPVVNTYHSHAHIAVFGGTGDYAQGIGIISRDLSGTNPLILIFTTQLDNEITFTVDQKVDIFVSPWNYQLGWPRVISNFEARTIYGGSRSYRDTVWNSQTFNGQFFCDVRFTGDKTRNFVTPDLGVSLNIVDNVAKPFNYVLNSAKYNDIVWISSTRSLLVGTSQNEFNCSDSGTFYSVETFVVKKQSSAGGSFVPVFAAESKTYYISWDGKDLREVSYSDENGSYLNTNLSLLADTIIDHNGSIDDPSSSRRFKKVSWDNTRNLVLLLIENRVDGVIVQTEIVGINIDRSTGVLGWLRFTFPKQTKIHSMLAMPNSDQTGSDIWVLVTRDDNFCLEKIPLNFNGERIDIAHDNLNDRPSYLDSHQWVTTTDGKIVFDNHYDPTTDLQVVSNGIVIDEFCVGDLTEWDLNAWRWDTRTENRWDGNENLLLGIAYRSLFRALPIEAGGQFGSATTAKQRINRVMFKVYRSWGGEFGSDDIAAYPLVYPLGLKPGHLFTGNLVCDFDATADESTTLLLQSEDPVPMTILGVYSEGVTGEQ